jgi:hypothetical protein
VSESHATSHDHEYLSEPQPFFWPCNGRGARRQRLDSCLLLVVEPKLDQLDK